MSVKLKVLKEVERRGRVYAGDLLACAPQWDVARNMISAAIGVLVREGSLRRSGVGTTAELRLAGEPCLPSQPPVEKMEELVEVAKELDALMIEYLALRQKSESATFWEGHALARMISATRQLYGDLTTLANTSKEQQS